MKSAADKQRVSDFYRNASAKEMTVVQDMVAGKQYWHALYGMSEQKERKFYADLSERLSLEAEGKPLTDVYAGQPLRHFSDAIEVRVREIFGAGQKSGTSKHRAA